MAKLKPEHYYALARVIDDACGDCDMPPKAIYEQAALQTGFSMSQIYRILQHYRVFCKCLGFGPELFTITLNRLDKLKPLIDWDYRQGKILAGLNGKLNFEQAQELIQGELNGRH